MNNLILHQVDITHYRLIELSRLADQAKPFYDWVEKIDRLEGSRRSIKGHHLEASARTAIITAFQNSFSIHGNYGKYKKITIADKQIQIGNHTIDVSVELMPLDNSPSETLLMPIKTRETEGGGHSHIFTRDIIAAVRELKEDESRYHMIAVIVALNWSLSELGNIDKQIDKIFHFNMNPNQFVVFDEASQIELNKYIQGILDNG